MSKRDVRVRLADMLSHAEDVRAFTEGLDWAVIVSDKMRRYAVLRALEVGEAATHVPREIRERAPDVPWTAVVGMRNRLIHGYDSLDDARLQRIVREQVPVLIGQLRSLLKELQ